MLITILTISEECTLLSRLKKKVWGCCEPLALSWVAPQSKTKLVLCVSVRKPILLIFECN